ncbi:sodium-coupled monocarboxylate transporter 1 [Anopheles aquasalis]|uniref:sodium-coupled monocarboxylate transporter 1 n=1 Tax=Anopheles aquasalis TaxID=42839 RepID=UPI00215A2D81|nr:sodium-coupled monocarboxylate transporter 1 [Anopheles aquasalis]
MATEMENMVEHMRRFAWPDYLVFVSMLLLCILIGVYFGFVQRKPNTEAEYLMGGRTMLVFPIALSLIASFISGITLLGLPTEVYSFGIQYVYVALGVTLMGIVMGYIYLPVFHKLNITSTYEYLETRFDRRLRMFGSIMFTIMNIGYLPIVIYVPALAFNQVTGVNIHVITPIVCIVCVFYTCVGGLKAVVWTDVVQTFSMFGALVLVAVKGTIDLGGSSVVFNRAWDTGRLERPNFDFNPTIRHTFWSQLIGGFVYWLQTNAVSQNMIQRYLSLPSVAAGRRALWIFVFGVCLLMSLCSYCGLLIYATYQDCDPLTTKLARAKDQLLPLFVMDILRDMPGLSGLFVAGVFSAALSSLSTCLNSMSAVILEDFVKPFVKEPLSPRAINWIMRSVVVGVGALCAALVFVVEKMGTVLQLTMSLEAITNGPLLGTFTIGILIPWVGSGCALVGGIVGVVFMSWLSLKAQYWVATGTIVFPHKPMSVEGCSYEFDHSLVNVTSTSLYTTDDIFPLFRVSYMWYTFLGAGVTILVSLLSTMLIYGRNDPKTIPPELLAGFVSRYVHGSDKSVTKDSTAQQRVPASMTGRTNGKTLHESAL